VSVQDFEDALGIAISDGNDCWGYTSPSGREYALMGLDSAMAVVDLTDPTSPVILGGVPHPSSPWADVKSFGERAYVVNESGGGVQVVDLSRVDEGIVTLETSIDLGGQASTSHNIALNEASGFAYLCGSNGFNGGLVALDLSNPGQPVLAGAYTDTYVHDAEIVSFTTGPNAGREIAFCYVGERGIDIVDVTDKSNMFRVSRTTYPGLEYAHQGWFDPERGLLFTNDEVDEIVSGGPTMTRVFDVASIEAPVRLGEFTSGLQVIDHNLYARDGIVFQANYRSGLRVFDASGDPTDPVETGFFDTFPGPDAIEFDGAWSVYPFFERSTVIVSDIQGGLFVLDAGFAIAGGSPASIEILERPGATASPGVDAVRARVTAQGDAALDGLPRLVVDTPTGPAAFEMVAQGDDVYEAIFPDLACGATASYFVQVETTVGLAVSEPLGAPLGAFETIVASEEAALFADDFQSDRGWIVGSPDDDAVTGVWERAEPIGTAAAPGEDATPGPGGLCYVTGAGSSGGGLGDDDVDGGRTTLTSPALDATGDGVAFIEYARWYSNDRGASPDEDAMVVLISNDNGANWTTLEVVDENAQAWVTRRFRLADLVTPTDRVRVRFIASDEGGGSIVEAGVDDVRVWLARCVPACPADVSGDGRVDAADLAVLVAGWGAAGLGDLDGSGAIDAADLAALIATWGPCE